MLTESLADLHREDPDRGRQAHDRAVHALLDRRRRRRFGRYAPRRARLRGQDSTPRRAIGTWSATTSRSSSSRTRSSSRPDPFGEDGGRPGLSAGSLGARHLLGLHRPDAREHPHDHVGDVGPHHPRSLRMMEGFGIHTFRLVNAARARRPSSSSTGGRSSGRPVDLLGRGGQDRWRRSRLSIAATCSKPSTRAISGVGVRRAAVDQDEADALPFDVLDPTKLIPEELLPIRMIGRMVLDRYPDNFFAETEQVAFLAGQHRAGRRFHQRSAAAGPAVLLSRHAAVKRLGSTNFHQMPINQLQMPGDELAARRPYADGRSPRAAPITSPTALMRATAIEGGGPRECPMTGFTSFAGQPDADEGRQGAHPRRELSPTITARRGCSSARRQAPSRRIWPGACVRAVQGRRWRMCALRDAVQSGQR
jgi:hypothetical protein